MNTQIQDYLEKFVAMFKEELRENLLGIYLHGSLAMGCFNPLRSDIDLLVVIKEKMSVENNKRIARNGYIFTTYLQKEKAENGAKRTYPVSIETWFRFI